MNRLLLLLLCLAAVPVAGSQQGALRVLRWEREGDTLKLRFGFGGGSYPPWRVRACPQEEARPCIHVEFSDASLGPDALKDVPRWIRRVPETDTGLVHLVVSLEHPRSIRYAWDGNWLDVDVLDRRDPAPLWRNPWVLGGGGAALIAGGIAFWLLNQSSSSSQAQDDIPPPDINMPK
jgi:hypothetical protein